MHLEDLFSHIADLRFSDLVRNVFALHAHIVFSIREIIAAATTECENNDVFLIKCSLRDLTFHAADNAAVERAREAFIACDHHETGLPCSYLKQRMSHNVGGSG